MGRGGLGPLHKFIRPQFSFYFERAYAPSTLERRSSLIRPIAVAHPPSIRVGAFPPPPAPTSMSSPFRGTWLPRSSGAPEPGRHCQRGDKVCLGLGGNGR